MIKMKRAVIYIRESTKFQDPDTQERECLAYCENNNFQIVKTYKDIASGKKNDRKGFLQMLDDLDEDRFDILVLWELSRSTRDFITYKSLLDTLTQKNKELHSLQEGILTQGDIDAEFSNDIRALINVHERKRVGRRIKYRKNFKTREGYWTNGKAPFGYKLENGILIPHEDNSLVVKEIFELFIAGISIEELTKKFNIPRRRISRILSNVVYLGKLKVNETEIINDKRIRNKEVEIVKGKHQAIISNEIFSLANNLRRKKPSKYKEGQFILPNVYCWTGEKMYPVKSMKQEYYSSKYSKEYVDKEYLEKIVLDNILNFNFNTLNENMEIIDYTERKNFYKKEIEKLKNNEKKLLKKFLDNIIEEETFDNFMKNNKKNIIEFEHKISEIEKLILNSSKKEDNAKLLKEYISALKNTNDRVQLQQILNILISEIRLVNNFRCVVITTIF